jgi:hypothetical protein
MSPARRWQCPFRISVTRGKGRTVAKLCPWYRWIKPGATWLVTERAALAHQSNWQGKSPAAGAPCVLASVLPGGEIGTGVRHVPAQKFAAPFQVGLRFFDQARQSLEIGKRQIDR